ncbi:ectonucleoside triphosphate diphosphohydrolase 5-like isoform X2 [Rhopalosiphum maidis]|nr:ectonucleoside triphosphate diphosphohydrolase 5-like isoform X2 [Rhopalosiphum maidis]
MQTTVTIIRFIVIYSQFTILYLHNVVEVNAAPSTQQSNQSHQLNCVVIIDAGSTGSKVLAAAFKKKDGSYLLDNYIFKREEGGLAEYADDEKKREDIIRHLLEQAEDFMNKNPHCARTPLLLRATAGLRMLNEKSDEIINQVKRIFGEYSAIFQVDDNSVEIMDGSDEGLFAWFTVNYLLKRLEDLENSVAVLDLGGASLQITFYPTDDKKIPMNTSFIKEYAIMGKTKKLYNQSYLGFGYKAVRTKVFKSVDNSKINYTSPCQHTADQVSYSFNLINYSITAENAERSPDLHYLNCKNYIENIVKETVEPVHLNKNIVAISFFYYQALNAEMIDEHGGDVTLQQFEKVAKKCFDQEFDRKNPFKCFDLIYIYVLFLQGFGFPDDTPITFKKYINNFQLSWPLGAAYQALQ